MTDSLIRAGHNHSEPTDHRIGAARFGTRTHWALRREARCRHWPQVACSRQSSSRPKLNLMRREEVPLVARDLFQRPRNVHGSALVRRHLRVG